MEVICRKGSRLVNAVKVKMKWWRFVLLILFGISLFTPQAKASKEEIAVLLNLLVEKGAITKEESKEILAAVENIAKKQKADAEKQSVKTSAAEKMKIGGYLQTRYDVYDYSGKTDQFSIKRARIGISGNVIENVDYKLEFDLVKGSKNDLLTDAWVKFTKFPQANITIGQFKIPFSEEYLTSSSALDTIERALPVGKMATEYDIGVMLDGKLFDKKLGYGIAFVNGAGGNSSDDNDEKDIVRRVVFSPWAGSTNPLANLDFGVAYQTGQQKTGANKEDRNRSDIMLKYSYKNFKALAEFLNQEIEKGSTKTKSDGYFVQCAYNIPVSEKNSIEPVVKYEVYDPDTKTSKNTQNIFTAGFNFHMGKNVKFSSNYRWRSDDAAVGKKETNSNEWFSQVQIKY